MHDGKISHGHALKLLAEVPPRKHFALFYENPERALTFQVWYLIHGFVKGDQAVFISRRNAGVVRKAMIERGVDVAYFETERGLLQIRKLDYPEGIDHRISEMGDKLSKNLGMSKRVVGDSVDPICSLGRAAASIEIENKIQKGFEGKAPPDSSYSVFKDFRGSMICSYPICEEGSELHEGWMRQCASAHDGYFLVNKDGRLVPGILPVRPDPKHLLPKTPPCSSQ